MAELITTAEAPPPGGAYSQAFRTGATLWLAGQVGRHPSTGEVADGLAAQTRQALRNLATSATTMARKMAMTRPRIWGSVDSCMVLLAVVVKVWAAMPTIASMRPNSQ